MNSKAIRKQLLAAVAMVLVAAVALGSSTYAWFVTNASVTATGVKATSTTSSNLLISKSPTGADNTFATTVDFGVDLAAFTPVSAGENLIKAGTLYKVQEWTAEASTGTFTSDAGKLANTFAAATANTDYVLNDIWLKSTSSGDIYFDANTLITLSVSVPNPGSENVYRAYLYYKPGANGTGADPSDPVTTYDLKDGGSSVGSDQITGDLATAYDNAKARLNAALGSLRMTLVKMDGTNARDTQFYNFSSSTAGNYNTVTAYNGNTNISTDQVISAVSKIGDTEIYQIANTSGLESDPSSIITAAKGTGDSGLTVGTAAKVCTLTANEKLHYKMYVYLEGCDKQCITNIANDVTYNIALGFSMPTGA